jgi:iron(III) transport system ATP-binding protein
MLTLPKGLELQSTDMDLAFRPHAVRFVENPDTDLHHNLALNGEIVDSEFLGEFIRYEVRVGQAMVKADIPHARGVTPLQIGVQIHLRIPSQELRFVTA